MQGETVIVTYRYRVPVDIIGRNEAAIRLALHDDAITDGARNSIWINWANAAQTNLSKQPKAIINGPRQMNIERAKNSKRIIAASVENVVMPAKNNKTNSHFQLRWAL
ncbi:MAG: hypothetical protein HC782_00435 [Gammaproteobacteria bacterium]|nr:hypothetical protein [Gammaproteobacteria bacterium]